MKNITRIMRPEEKKKALNVMTPESEHLVEQCAIAIQSATRMNVTVSLAAALDYHTQRQVADALKEHGWKCEHKAFSDQRDNTTEYRLELKPLNDSKETKERWD